MSLLEAFRAFPGSTEAVRIIRAYLQRRSQLALYHRKTQLRLSIDVRFRDDVVADVIRKLVVRCRGEPLDFESEAQVVVYLDQALVNRYLDFERRENAEKFLKRAIDASPQPEAPEPPSEDIETIRAEALALLERLEAAAMRRRVARKEELRRALDELRDLAFGVRTMEEILGMDREADEAAWTRARAARYKAHERARLALLDAIDDAGLRGDDVSRARALITTLLVRARPGEGQTP